VDNGQDDGQLIFNVPTATAQDFYTNMPIGTSVNLAIQGLAYKDIQGKYLSTFLTSNDGIDGNHDINHKTFIFVDNNIDDNDWIATAPYDDNLGFGTEFDDGEMVPQQHRTGVWQVHLEYDAGQDDHIIHLTAEANLTVNTAVNVLEGDQFNDRSFYLNTSTEIELIPLITALQDTFYYQDGTDDGLVGVIKLVEENESYLIDVEADILGKTVYTSPNGVVFTNGLKVKFDSSVTPASYANKEFYVEGVGNKISLSDSDLLLTPESYVTNELEPFDSNYFDSSGYEGGFNAPIIKDYITINRSSIDGNPWSRSNRWFHIDVIRAAADYENVIINIDQDDRANRPIIEFNANIQLYNTGSTAVPPVEVLEINETDALSNVHGSPSPYVVDGVTLEPGMRVLFINDDNEDVRTHVYTVSYVDVNNNGNEEIILTPDVDALVDGSNLLIRFGLVYQAQMYHLTNNNWISSQAKTGQNQPPKFDIFVNNVSLSDLTEFPNSSFKGSEIFSYAIGTGTNDTILGFPLKYKNFATVGDIVFENDFDADEFTYTVNQITVSKKINSGVLHKVSETGNTPHNMWSKINENSHQNQLFTFPVNEVNVFTLDIAIALETQTKHHRVFADLTELSRNDYYFTEVDDNVQLVITTDISSIDEIKLLVNGTTNSNSAYYQIPSNLENNAQNAIFVDLTLGQIRNHINEAFSNSNNLDGIFPGESDLRDKQHSLDAGGNILQHSAGLGYANLFLLDDKANFIDATLHAQQEYTRFKNKFVNLTTILDIDVNDPITAVDTIIDYINDVKTKDFPWYSSDMIPYGTDTTVTEYEVIQLVDKDYELVTLFDNTALSNKSVLIYINDVQLLNKVDFEYNSDKPYITIRDDYDLQLDDIIRIVEYHNTDGNWIPETPSKLGLYPAFTPARYIDDAYISDVEVIRGHDGSLTPVYNDFRDDIILELEKRIYNNIKVTYKEDRLSINSIKPGKFRNNDYELQEFNATLSRMFFKFVGENKIDYRTNNAFDPTEEFTYNYRKFGDKIDATPLQGSWKAIYNYYYDTIHPNTRPWEMLGFSIMPNWWEDNYGPAPYTSGNLVLWDDLAAGKIKDGERAGIDPLYIRPGLQDIIPVNQFGELLPPMDFLVNGPAVQYANLDFTIGEEGPVETAWRTSSMFPYAMQMAMALLKPAKYFGLYADVQTYNYNVDMGQYLHDTTNQRLTQLDLEINGETKDDEFLRAASYINWIADYIKSDNVSPTSYLGNMLSNYSVNLAYKVAGFTDKKYLKVIAEQSSPSSNTSSIIMPDEDYQIKLNKTAPLIRVNYSAVIVQKTMSGFKIDGYNLANPHFTILPSIQNNNTTSITVLSDTVKIFRNYSNQPVSVPYGHEFTNKESVIDFLLGYGRWLERQGFIFNEYNTDIKEISNWLMSSKEFLYWTQQGWGENNVMVLNPLANKVYLNTPGAVVGEITQTSPNSITDQNFKPITNNNFTVKRIDNQFELEITDKRALGFLEFSLIQHEHILIFNNITVFNDIIYQSELGNRQIRLKLVGFVSNNWNGNLAPAGFVYNEDNVQEWQQGKDYKRGDIVKYKSNYYVSSDNLVAANTFDYTVWEASTFDDVKTGLLPNFSTLARRPEDYYEVDNVNLESQTDLFGKGLIGYRNRDYFHELGLDDTSQVKFYQGMIREKGTRSAVEALTRAQLKNDNADIEMYEEWALRVGEYGAIDSTQFIETRLDESKVTANPALLSFKNTGDDEDRGAVNIFPNDIHEGPVNYNKNLFLLEEYNRGLDHNIKTAGPATLDDVDYTLYSFDDYYSLNDHIAEIGIGDSIWIASDVNFDWSMFRVAGTVSEIRDIQIVDNVITCNTNIPHKLVDNDRVMLRNTGIVDGWYIVHDVTDLNSFTVLSQTTVVDIDITVVASIFKLVSSRYSTASELANTISPYIRDGEKIFIDVIDSSDNWAVIEKSSPWEFNTRVIPSPQSNLSRAGTSVDVSNDGLLIYSGSPGTDAGKGSVAINIRNSINEYNLLGKLYPPSETTLGFGATITAADDKYIAVGAPNSFNNSGQVFVYKFDSTLSNAYELTQVLAVDNLLSDQYLGSTIKLSDDNNWLYVAEPGASTVRAYMLTNSIDPATDTITTSTPSPNPVFSLSFVVDNIEQLIIKDDTGKTYIPGIDYNVVGDDSVVFTTPFQYSLSGTRTVIFRKLTEYYKLVANLDAPDIIASDFNYSIGTNSSGSEIFIGAAKHDLPGEVFHYDRVVERHIAGEYQSEFSVTSGFSPYDIKVVVDGDEYSPNSYSAFANTGQIIFDTFVPVNALVDIEINKFQFIQTLLAPAIDRHTNDQFGYALDLCSTGCSAVIGMPGYDKGDTQTNNGCVYSLTNQASKFGTITSLNQNPALTAGYIMGGGRDECLREVELLMSAFNIKHKQISEFIY